MSCDKVALTCLNDNFQRDNNDSRYSFEQIADYIENNLEKIFTDGGLAIKSEMVDV